MSDISLAKAIDHTLLKPDSTRQQIVELCEEAKAYQFATVCIQPTWVPTAKALLEDSDVGITTVIGFPLGSTSTFTKVAETRDAIASGATEVDMVINIGAYQLLLHLKRSHLLFQVQQKLIWSSILAH